MLRLRGRLSVQAFCLLKGGSTQGTGQAAEPDLATGNFWFFHLNRSPRWPLLAYSFQGVETQAYEPDVEAERSRGDSAC